MLGGQTLSAWADVAAHIATCLAALAAAFWFVFTANYRKKIEFNVNCSAFRHPKSTDKRLIELIFELDNKGQRENHCYTLAYELQSVDPEHGSDVTPMFIMRSGNAVPAAAEYYYVRAGVIQRISARLWIPADIPLIRVRAFILYENRRNEIQKDRDLFKEMYRFTDWTALDRVFQVDDSSSVAVSRTTNARRAEAPDPLKCG